MTYSLDQHRRRSIRLSGYDYSQNGAYFVTVCTKNREGLFGEMRLNDAGNIACQCWKDIPLHFPHVGPDGFVIMPNHIHGILFINDIVGAKNFSPLQWHGVSFYENNQFSGNDMMINKYIIAATIKKNFEEMGI